MRVQVYWNIHKRVWSIRDKTTRRVVAHAATIEMDNVKFHVSAKGNARVRREKTKNIHAWVEGDLLHHDTRSDYAGLSKDMRLWAQGDMYRVNYNPYKVDRFKLQTYTEVESDPNDMTWLWNIKVRFHENGSAWLDMGARS